MDRVVELFLAFAIAIVASVQLYTTINNNSGTSQQTDQLIAAAKISAYASNQNAQASRNFADSARSINGGINDAVGKLSRQASIADEARATSQEASRESLSSTIRAFHLDQRAWVSIKSVKLTKPLSVSDKAEITVTLANTGKSLTCPLLLNHS